jgi:hypothetical protein
MIDSVLGEDFMSGIRFSAPAKFYPGEVIGSSGKPWMGLADGETNTIWLSKYTMGSRRDIADTLIHEELHFRLAARQGIPLGQQAAYEDWIAARATRIITRKGY